MHTQINIIAMCVKFISTSISCRSAVIAESTNCQRMKREGEGE